MTSHCPNHDRSPTLQINIKNLIDDVQCYQTVRELRWPEGIACPSCASKQVIKRGFDETEPARQRYACHDCHTRFDDVTDSIRLPLAAPTGTSADSTAWRAQGRTPLTCNLVYNTKQPLTSGGRWAPCSTGQHG